MLLALFLLCACDRNAADRDEARALLAAIHVVQDESSLAKRQRALDGLLGLPLLSESHKRTRELCHAAHLGLLRAETEQALARQAFEAESSGQAGAPIPPARAHAIAELIARSNEALEDAKKRFPGCESAMAGLVAQAH